jgi:AcrR family transcriptional regulator
VRKGLTKAKILAGAKVLVEQGGPAALTMRALAAGLGVAPMALYNHFHDRDAILDAMAEGVFEQLRESAAAGSGLARRGRKWPETLRAVLMTAQKLADENPHIFRLALSRPNKPPSAFALAADSIGLLEAAGLSRAQSITVYHAFAILLQGYPFWQEGIAHHGLAIASGIDGKQDPCIPGSLPPADWTAGRQFEAIVDWLLGCVADLAAAR